MLNGALATDGQCEALFKAALEACERYYQAFQFVVWAGKDSREALASSHVRDRRAGLIGAQTSTYAAWLPAAAAALTVARRLGCVLGARPAREVCPWHFSSTEPCCSPAPATWAARAASGLAGARARSRQHRRAGPRAAAAREGAARLSTASRCSAEVALAAGAAGRAAWWPSSRRSWTRCSRRSASSRGKKTVVVSVAAGRRIDGLEPHVPAGTAVVRAMPNTPASVGRGITVAVGNAH